jgi:hypothetical protein
MIHRRSDGEPALPGPGKQPAASLAFREAGARTDVRELSDQLVAEDADALLRLRSR